MIAGALLPGLFWSGNAKFKFVFFPLDYRFLFETPEHFNDLCFCCYALCKAF